MKLLKKLLSKLIIERINKEENWLRKETVN